LENISQKKTVSDEVGQGNILPSGMDIKFKFKPIKSLYMQNRIEKCAPN
jgi:hypothetical protein